MDGVTQRKIVIGDVHGHFAGLMALFEAMEVNSQDQVYFLGDVIDRGPQSAEVIDFIQLNNYQSLLGNHEQMLIEAFPSYQPQQRFLQAWLYAGGEATLDSYRGNTFLLMEHIRWMKELPLYLDLGDIWLVHAGLDPLLPLEKQSSQEFCWIREEFHFTEQPYFPEKTIITGHTITFTLPGVTPGQLAQGAGWINIETGAYHPRSGWLTGLDWTNRHVYQVNVYSSEIRSLPLEEAIASIVRVGCA